ncbi:MAG: orotate phosphoribosyltransferase [Anaerolineae bacterium]|nr:orotate phosphoribosyltransferase [Anaerolineae bacterium]
MIELESLILDLHDLGAVQLGEFTLKSGEISPIYLDLRLLVSRPKTLRRVAQVLQGAASPLKFDRLAAIPLAGLPIGVALSMAMDCPLIYPRMQAKGHGTGRQIEGEYKAGETVLLVDDVISRGDSKLEAIAELEAAGLKVPTLLMVVDREMGGVQDLADKGYQVHCALTMHTILDTLRSKERITEMQREDVLAWLENREKGLPVDALTKPDKPALS